MDPMQPMGLRERKKARTREALRAHALRLFVEQGFDATTLDQVAAAADVSPRTLYRYFPTKEDLVLTDDYDPMLWVLIAGRPAGEGDLTAVQEALVQGLSMIEESELSGVATRSRLAMAVPSLRARVAAEQQRTADDLGRAIATRHGREQPTFEDRMIATAATATLAAAVAAWVEDGAQTPLAGWIARAMDAVIGAENRTA